MSRLNDNLGEVKPSSLYQLPRYHIYAHMIYTHAKCTCIHRYVINIQTCIHTYEYNHIHAYIYMCIYIYAAIQKSEG